MTQSEQVELGFSSVKGRRMLGRFDGGEISSDGGIVLLERAEQGLRLLKTAARDLTDSRQRGKVRHQLETVLRQRVFGLAAGWEDLNDFESLREDVLWQSACGSDAPLAGKSTLSRLERSMRREAAVSINRLLVEHFIASHKSAPEEIVLDFDATDDPVHGQQEGRFFHGYYDHYCFLPLYVFCGEQLLCAYLRPSNQDAAKHSAAILKLLVSKIRIHWPNTRIIFRADSGFCRDRTLTWCDRHGVDYVVGLAKNPALLDEAEALLEQARQSYQKNGYTQRIFGGIIYAAAKWKLKRHIIVKAEHGAKGANPRFVVSSLDRDDREVYEQLYCARGEAENRIKEQMQLFSDRTSASYWWANQWRVCLSALAYTLLEHIRTHALKGTELARAQCATLRLKLLKIGAVIVRLKRLIRIHFSHNHPAKELFILAAQKLKPG